MKSSLKINTPILFVLFVMAIFISIFWVQKTNNALPFFYKNYPTYENNGKKNFDSVSESLVLNRIDFSTLSLEYTSKFNLWRANHEVRAFTDTGTGTGKSFDKEYITTPDYLLDGQSYQSQIGAQSLFFATLAKTLNTDHGHYSSIKAISVFLLSMCAAIILLWIKINFGTIPSAVSFLAFALSTGANIFSESIYWSIWLFILPLSVVCLLEILKIKNNFYIFLFTLPTFLFKFLSGYEFITIIVFAAMTPYAWGFFVAKEPASFMRAITVGISSVTAFLISILIYNSFFLQEFNSSGIDNIFGRSGSWSLGHLGELSISPWMQSAKIMVMNYMDINGYGIPLVGFLALILISLAVIRNRVRLDDIKFIAFIFIGSISWLIVQPGHVLFHPRYATLMFFIPFGLFIPGFIASLVYGIKNQQK